MKWIIIINIQFIISHHHITIIKMLTRFVRVPPNNVIFRFCRPRGGAPV